ncbi:MAG: hypothetical protein P8X87_08055 [Candidatus Bathyarchaeota archaeon]
MILGIFHDEKCSSSKGQSYIMIDMLESNTNNAKFIPVALIQNTPALLESRKKNLANLPIGQNIQVIDKDKLHVQVMGNTFFAGWTVPLKITPRHTLPPACILFEGFGDIKSGMFTNQTPINRKYEIWYNSIDAFVSFFLPEYKYIGSGSEGYIDVDSVWISKLC